MSVIRLLVGVSFWPGLAIRYCKGHPCLVLPQKIHYKKLKMVRFACSFARSISFIYGTSTVCYPAVLLKEGRYLAWVGFSGGIESAVE